MKRRHVNCGCIYCVSELAGTCDQLRASHAHTHKPRLGVATSCLYMSLVDYVWVIMCKAAGNITVGNTVGVLWVGLHID